MAVQPNLRNLTPEDLQVFSEYSQMQNNMDQWSPLARLQLTRKWNNISDQINRPVTGGGPPKPAVPSLDDILKQIKDYENSGYGNNLIPDSLVNDWINQTVASQGNSILGDLSKGRADGSISGVGYDAAMNLYNTQKGTAEQQLRDLAEGILDSGRYNLTDTLSKAKDDAAKNPAAFKFDDVIKNINTQADTFKAGLPGQLTSAVGKTNYFDRDAIWKGIAPAQGSFNMPSPSLISAVEGRNRSNAIDRPGVAESNNGYVNTSRRSLTSTGRF